MPDDIAIAPQVAARREADRARSLRRNGRRRERRQHVSLAVLPRMIERLTFLGYITAADVKDKARLGAAVEAFLDDVSSGRITIQIKSITS